MVEQLLNTNGKGLNLPAQFHHQDNTPYSALLVSNL